MVNKPNDAYMHKFSRGVSADGQVFPDQSTAKSGHNVSYVEVRADDIPVCRDYAVRDIQLLNELENGKRVVKDEYKNILKFWDKVPLTLMPNSNGESWRLLDEDNLLVSDFIDPTDQLIDGRFLSDGYRVCIYDAAGNKISPHQGWSFESYSGLLKFEAGKTPEEMGYGIPRIEIFSYVGKNTKEKFRDVEELIACYYKLMKQIANERIAIQPYQFTTEKMTKIGEPFVFPGAFNRFGKPMWAQSFQIKVPGYVFETTAMDKNETMIVDYKHDENGDSILTIDVEIDPISGLPVIGYSQALDVDNDKTLKLEVGHVMFKCATFKRSDGKKIELLPIVEIGISNSANSPSPVSAERIREVESRRYIVDFEPNIR